MRSVVAIGVVLALAPAEASAQASSLPSRLWLTAGAGSATLHGDCQTCEGDYPYRHGSSVLVNAGYRVNTRMDVGGEVLGRSPDVHRRLALGFQLFVELHETLIVAAGLASEHLLAGKVVD